MYISRRQLVKSEQLVGCYFRTDDKDQQEGARDNRCNLVVNHKFLLAEAQQEVYGKMDKRSRQDHAGNFENVE